MEHGATILKTAISITSTGLILNAIVILPNIWRLHSLPPSSVLIIFLCCSDSLLLGNYLTQAAVNLKRVDSEYEPVACNIPGFLTLLGGLMSLGFCGGLTLFRYLIIVRKKAISLHFTLLYAGGVLAVVSIIASLPIIFNDRPIYVLHPTRFNCTITWSSADIATRVISVLCGLVLMAPLSSMGYAYYCIYREVSNVFIAFRNASLASEDTAKAPSSDLRRPSQISVPESGGPISQNKRLSHEIPWTGRRLSEQRNSIASWTADAPAAADEESQRKASARISQIERIKSCNWKKRTAEETRQMGLLVQSVAIVSLFVIGWTPYYVMAFYEFLTNAEASLAFEFAAEMALALQDVLNPIVVLIFDDKIRQNSCGVFEGWRRREKSDANL
ncbi:hypothetical protein HDU77_004747 [Chytriomyces hyalinus]|nr:hypothetical protein HDU77_004747 [Chytriomyces hyalinus]